jgi:hypothetical protein
MGEGWKCTYFRALRTSKFEFSDETEKFASDQAALYPKRSSAQYTVKMRLRVSHSLSGKNGGDSSDPKQSIHWLSYACVCRSVHTERKLNSVAFSPQANYTDPATAA